MSFNIEGALTIESDNHIVEYEPGAMVGGQTLFLRVKDGDKNVPIFVDRIDEVIEMLRRGKAMIEALEK